MKRRRVAVWRVLGLLTGMCVLVLLVFLLRDRSGRVQPPSRQKKAPEHPPLTPDQPGPSPRVQPASAGKESPVRFGILGPAVDASEWYRPLSTALKYVEQSGCPCEVAAPPGTDPRSLKSLLSGEDINVKTSSLDAALKRVDVLLSLFEADLVTAAKLKPFVASGGWLVSSADPELVREVAGLPPGSTVKLNSIWDRGLRTRNTLARFLVSHPVLPETLSREWFRIPTLEGKAEPTRPRTGLWLIAFRNPFSPGLRILPSDKGGIVEFNWKAWKWGDLEGIESREFLRKSIAWLSRKRRWETPTTLSEQKVSGKVTDEDGSAIAEATITARVFADWGAEVEELSSKSDKDGNFSLSAAGPSIYWLKVSADGFAQQAPFVMTRCEEGIEQKPLTVIMGRAVGLLGTVYYEGRETNPAGEFPVTLIPADRDPFIEKQTTVSDQQGRFAFEKVPFGKTFLVFSQKEEWGGWKMVELPLDPEKEPERFALAIERVPPVYGRVVEHQTLKPIPGAEVDVSMHEHPLNLFSGSLKRFEKSDEEKGFSFRLLPGRWYLEGAAENCWPTQTRVEDGSYKELGRVQISIAYGKSQPESPLLLELTRGRESRDTQFYGTVYFPSGDPAPNAFIWHSSAHLSRSDAEGKYETDHLSCNQGRTIDGVHHYEFAFEVRCRNCCVKQAVVLPELPERHQVDFWLEEGLPAKGFVRDIKGNPVEGAKVTAGFIGYGGGRVTDFWERSEPVFSGPDGSFTFPGAVSRNVPRWERGITLRAERTVTAGGAVVREVGIAEVIAPQSEPIENFDVIIARTGPVSGTISYHDGTPVRNKPGQVNLGWGEPGDRGWASHWEGHTDDGGRFFLEVPGFRQEIVLPDNEKGRPGWRGPAEPPPETYTLLVGISGSEEGSTIVADKQAGLKEVKVGTTDLQVRFPPMGSMHARVVDGFTGLPMEHLGVRTFPNRDEQIWPPGSAWTGEVHVSQPFPGGEFWLFDLIPCNNGTYRLELYAQGYRVGYFEEVPVAGNQTTELGKLPIYRQWPVRGRVLAADTGQPISATIIPSEGYSPRTDQNGEFALTMEKRPTPCTFKIVPADKAWKETELGPYSRGDPGLDLGDILLQPAPAQ